MGLWHYSKGLEEGEVRGPREYNLTLRCQNRQLPNGGYGRCLGAKGPYSGLGS